MSTLLLRTTIRPEMHKWALLKGVALTTAALSCIWVGELLLPFLGFESLAGWLGWTLRTAAMGAGYVPFQKLSKQKHNPEVLHIDEYKLVLYQGDTALFMIPWNQIVSFDYLDRSSSYGFTFMLKSDEKLSLQQNPKELLLHKIENYWNQEPNSSTSVDDSLPASPYKAPPLPQFLLQKSRKEYGVDLFLPYFSESSFQMLKQWHTEIMV